MADGRFYLSQQDAGNGTHWMIFDSFNGRDYPVVVVHCDHRLAEDLVVWLNQRNSKKAL